MAKELTARKNNKLQLELQVVLVKCLTLALKYSFNGKSRIWGREVTETELNQAKIALKELDRKQGIYDSEKYKKLPYLPSNSSVVEKTKAHLHENGVVNFVELKSSNKAESVKRHLNTKAVVKKQISNFNKQQQKQSPERATNMATAKKANSKKTTKVSKQAKKAAAQPYAQKGKTVAQRIREAYDKNPKGFDKAEFAKKSGIPYGLVYGCITKYEAKLAESKPAKAAAKKPAKKAAAAAE